MTLQDKLRDDFNFAFGRPWPVWIGGILIGLFNVMLFIYHQPWSTLDGALNWGDWMLSQLGLIQSEPLSPLLRSGSVINLGLLGGAVLSAMLAGQFGIRAAPLGDLVKGAIGGIMIGAGAVLVRGCNIGGFFNGTSALSLHGVAMGLGLVVGALIGTRILVWQIGKSTSDDKKQIPIRKRLGLASPKRQRMWGLGLGLFLAGSVVAYLFSIAPDRGVILMFGIVLGIICQRSRLCFVRAFREPFLTGDASHTKAMLIALLISIAGFSIVKYTLIERVDEFVRATYWMGSLSGGVIFGIGMTIAGGCGAGAVWRAGEGHLKLWLTLICYTLSASFFNRLLQTSGLTQQLGQPMFLPDIIGWGGATIALLALLVIWYLLVQSNEISRKWAAI
ncbi:MAG: YeeE/YedE family protein [Anaerolineales bacterium]|nr:YeeE/YedE family protein [Anaerolineales bacterium]